MGRKSLFTPEVQDQIVAGIQRGLTDKDAALAAGISPSTLDTWKSQQDKKSFHERLTRARAQRTRRWLGYLEAAAEKGDVRAIEALLDRCAPDYRKTPQSIEITGANQGPVQHEYALTPEQRAVAERIAAKRGIDVADVISIAEARAKSAS